MENNDRDIDTCQSLLLVVTGFNLATAIVTLLTHHWLYGIASLVWLVSGLIQLQVMRVNRRIRNSCRISQELLESMIKERQL
jgi:hypothetical protein